MGRYLERQSTCKHCKSVHNLAQPSGKGLQTADNWLELELNGVEVVEVV